MVIFACMSCFFHWIAVIMWWWKQSRNCHNEVRIQVIIILYLHHATAIFCLQSKRVIFQFNSNLDCRIISSEESDHFIPVVSVAMCSSSYLHCIFKGKYLTHAKSAALFRFILFCVRCFSFWFSHLLFFMSLSFPFYISRKCVCFIPLVFRCQVLFFYLSQMNSNTKHSKYTMRYSNNAL